MRSNIILIFLAVIGACLARSIEEKITKPSKGYVTDLKLAYRVFEECNSKELATCLKLKFITAIDRVSRRMDIPLTDWLILVKESEKPEDNEVAESNLSRSLDGKEDNLNEIILKKISDFISARSLRIKLSGLEEVGRSLSDENEESRGKKNRYSSMMMFPLMMGTTMIPLALGVLALLAGKALIIAKLALVLSVIFGLRKIIGGDEVGHTAAASYQVHPGGHFRRSLETDPQAAQSMAYRSYIPLFPQVPTAQYLEDKKAA